MNKMNTTQPNAAINLRKNQFLVNPFVYKYQPYVSSCNTLNEPFIGKNIPNVCFKRIAQRIHGFTLIELVVTMVVASILVAIAVPNLRAVIQNTRITTRVNDLIADFNYARSEAIKRRSNVAVCRSSNGTSCAGTDWKDGRLIYADTNKNGALDVGEVILRFREASGGGDNTLTTVVVDPLVFTSNGAAVLLATQSFTFCDDRGATKGKRVQLNVTGQATVDPLAPAGC